MFKSFTMNREWLENIPEEWLPRSQGFCNGEVITSLPEALGVCGRSYRLKGCECKHTRCEDKASLRRLGALFLNQLPTPRGRFWRPGLEWSTLMATSCLINVLAKSSTLQCGEGCGGGLSSSPEPALSDRQAGQRDKL